MAVNVSVDEMMALLERHVKAGVPQDQVVDAFKLATKINQLEHQMADDLDPPVQLLAVVLNAYAKTHAFANSMKEIVGDNPEWRKKVQDGSPTAVLTRELLQKALADIEIVLAPAQVN